MATYKTNLPDGKQIHVQDTELTNFAAAMGLDKIAPGRYSTLFAFKMFLYTHYENIESHLILEEIKALEGKVNRAPGTKSPTQFTKQPLKGLWHQHFFSAQFAQQNIALQMTTKKISETVDRVMHPSKPIITAEMLDELAKAVTTDAFEERENQGKLTGEWIVFAKHNGQNYYLTLSVHPSDRSTGDQKLFDEIQSMAYSQFPFLEIP